MTGLGLINLRVDKIKEYIESLDPDLELDFGRKRRFLELTRVSGSWSRRRGKVIKFPIFFEIMASSSYSTGENFFYTTLRFKGEGILEIWYFSFKEKRRKVQKIIKYHPGTFTIQEMYESEEVS